MRGVSFQVNPGEKIGLVGRNGAGKTTIFRLITEEEGADSGDIVRINGLKLGLLQQHVDFDGTDDVHTAALSAFQRIHDIEAEMRLLEVRMQSDHSEEILHRYADLQIEFEQADGFTYTARAEAILLGLGFTREMWHLKTATLSGGQKNRLGMARLLLSSPDILLLDEPTNHLDVVAVEWLEDFLSDYEGTYVIISHDRYFLDRTSNKIIEVENGKTVTYKGNYSKFLVERELRREQQRREFENQQAFISKTQDFIRRNLEGQKTKQAKSRRTMLAKLERIDNISADKAGGNFRLNNVARAGSNVLTVEDLSIGYDARPLAENINFTLHRGEALGIIGGNGTGKTTFLKTILGDLREVGGDIRWGTKTDIGYYAQNLEDLDARNEVLQEIRRVAPLAESGVLRSFLAGFLFTGEDVFKRVADLSGGEKGRLALAKLIYSQKNVLVLDEPTNHLDIPSREALENALGDYPGTIITVSHDRFFLDKIATQILSFETEGKVETFNGNYSEFHDWQVSNNGNEGRTGPENERAASAEGENQGERTSSQTLSKNQLQRIENRIKEIEEEIPVLEEQLSRLSMEMADPEIAADAGALNDISSRYGKVESEIKARYTEWEELLEKLR